MEKINNKIFFVTFMIIWIILIILNFITPNVEFSEKENRFLARVPKFTFEKLVDGEYAQGLDSYINDHFIFRNNFLSVKYIFEISIGKTENNSIYIGKYGYLFEKFNVYENDYKNMDMLIQSINKFVDGIDVPTSMILVPNSIYVNSNYLPKFAYVTNQKEIIDYVYGKLKNMNKIDVTSKLIESKKDYLYFKTDHHMTSDAAFLVYDEYCENNGINTSELSGYTRKIVSNSFLGTFDSKAQVINQKKDEIVIYENEYNTNLKQVIYDEIISDSIYNYDYLEKKDKYSFFLNSNNARVVIQTHIQNGKKILVIKDSYAHIMAQFLCNDYEEIHFLDPRYYNASIKEYASNQGITEVLFLYNVSNFVKDLGLRGLK